jgi:hypothetical protein
MTEAAFMGVFSDFKLIKTRSVCQLIIEVPLEQADKCLAAMGGVPLPGQERPVAVARLQTGKPASPERPEPAEPDAHGLAERGNSDAPPKGQQWQSLRPSQQAGILCADAAFQGWIAFHKKWGTGFLVHEDQRENYTADLVRDKCGVGSRSELDRNHKASGTWEQIAADFRWHQSHGDQP